MTGNILAVDDEEGILRIIKRALEKDGCQVDTVSDPLLLKNRFLGKYDLILLDVMMPGVDGFSLCRRIRGEVDCPILFLTARTGEEDIMTGLGLGGDDYIRKPFGIGAGEMRFYLGEKRAVYRETELPFTKSEYEICEYLALHRGQVFSREQIYEHVFGYDGESDSSAITEHIKNIRAKCRAAGCEPVETVWGTGYRWKS